MNVPVRVSTVKLDQFDRDLGGSHFRSSKYGGRSLSAVATVIVVTINAPIANIFIIFEVEDKANMEYGIA